MISSFDNLHSACPYRNDGSSPNDAINRIAQRKATSRSGPIFSKIFRWQPPPGTPRPVSVEVAGTFTGWRALPFTRDEVTDTWQLRLDGIPGNRTHRYMLSVDGVPAPDKNCDGRAVPEDFEERQHQLMTARGPRIFLLFAQTK